MVRVSNIVLGIFNVIILIIGLGAIGIGFFFYLGSNSECEKGMENQLMIMGGALFVVSLLGLIGSCYGINFLLMLYLVVMFFLIVAFMVFTIFAITVTNEASGKVMSRTKIMNFRTWIEDYFVTEQNWNQIKTCLIDAKVCISLGADVENDVAQFYKKNLSPIQVFFFLFLLFYYSLIFLIMVVLDFLPWFVWSIVHNLIDHALICFALLVKF